MAKPSGTWWAMAAALLAGTPAQAEIVENAMDRNGVWDFGVTEVGDAGSGNGLLHGITNIRPDSGTTGRVQGWTGQEMARINTGSSLFVRAYGVCRSITNYGGLGGGVFVPLHWDAEWTQFLQNLPSGVSAAACCGPARVRMCGTEEYIGWHVDGESVVRVAGYGATFIYTCGADGNYAEVASGECDAPVPTGGSSEGSGGKDPDDGDSEGEGDGDGDGS